MARQMTREAREVDTASSRFALTEADLERRHLLEAPLSQSG
jgi:hypothetical protein